MYEWQCDHFWLKNAPEMIVFRILQGHTPRPLWSPMHCKYAVKRVRRYIYKCMDTVILNAALVVIILHSQCM